MYDNDRLDGFTEQAIKALKLAEVERQRFHDRYVDTEHLLLGLVGEREGMAAKVLNDFGVDLDKVRNQIGSMLDRSKHPIVADSSGWAPNASKMLEYAAFEARRLNDHSIGTGHLLSGLVRAGEGIALKVLDGLDVDREHVRKRTLQILSQMERSYGSPLQIHGQFSKSEPRYGSRIPHVRLVPAYAD